ncbi:MAG TPA: DUF4139 domain-containing protein, partial [Brevundimonas sp.]|nr:DUF4139 domain-containing protein [Brevundimonas sp.]
NGYEFSDGAEGIADYYIYPLPGRVTVANNQNKQVGLLDVANVPATKRYLFQMGGFSTYEQAQSAEGAVLFQNGRASGVSQALPAGVVRVYVRDAGGEPRFIGEDEIGHTPAGSDIAIT